MKISVIIPVFKVEQYLCQCIDSVLEQTYNDIEIVLVDDGSPDLCPRICDRYAEKDNRIIVIHQRNEGLSEARNTGVKHATGDYIMFLDSDDFWKDSYALERIALRLKKRMTDVLNYSYIKFNDNTCIESMKFHGIPDMPESMSTKEDQMEYMFNRSLYIASACNKAIKRELLSDDLRFEKGKTSEDIVWCLKLLKKAKSLDFVCENFYCYRQRDASITHSFSEKNCDDLIKNIKTCIEISNNRYEYQYCSYQIATFVFMQALLPEYSTYKVEQLAEHAKVLSYHGKNKKVSIIFLGSQIIGFKQMCRLYYIYVLLEGKIWK